MGVEIRHVRFDIQQRRTVQYVHAFDGEQIILAGCQAHNGQAERVGPAGFSLAHHARPAIRADLVFAWLTGDMRDLLAALGADAVPARTGPGLVAAAPAAALAVSLTGATAAAKTVAKELCEHCIRQQKYKHGAKLKHESKTSPLS